MMIFKNYADTAWEQTAALLAIDSPTGFTGNASAWLKNAFESLGCPVTVTENGGILADLGGADNGDGLLLAAHTDTLGAMVCQVKGNGRLKLTSLGGMNANNGEAENVRIYTRDGKVIEGTLQLCNASVHVNGDYSSAKRSFDTTEVVLDEVVESAADVEKLGIQVGDIVCFDPRTRRTASGYLKSRFLDDKLSVGILLGFAKYLKDNAIALPRKVYAYITVYEEVGHGGRSCKTPTSTAARTTVAGKRWIRRRQKNCIPFFWSSQGMSVEHRCGQIPIAGIRKQNNNILTCVFRAFCQTNCRRQRRTGGNTG